MPVRLAGEQTVIKGIVTQAEHRLQTCVLF